MSTTNKLVLPLSQIRQSLIEIEARQSLLRQSHHDATIIDHIKTMQRNLDVLEAKLQYPTSLTEFEVERLIMSSTNRSEAEESAKPTDPDPFKYWSFSKPGHCPWTYEQFCAHLAKVGPALA